MPLNEEEIKGTEKDGSPSEKYCTYCYKNGEYTSSDITLEEMIEISAKGWSEQDPNTSYEQAKEQLQKFLPYLDRWKK
jgi:hypothetical protein